MTPRQLNALADSLECGFMTTEDQKGWVSDLRAHARDLETGVIFAARRLRTPDPNETGQAGVSEIAA